VSEPLRARLGRFWHKHRTLFWTLHSVWALATGVVVILLARERYGFVPWVVLFLAITWASTLYFARKGATAPRVTDGGAPVPGAAEEATSYVTRTLYQETLFFLLPFYAYSTVIRSPNVVFVALLAGLAVFSCLDLVFDRWLRTSRVFSLLFFAVVTYAAINLLLPILLPLDPTTGGWIAAAVAVVAALPLARQGAEPNAGAGVAVASGGSGGPDRVGAARSASSGASRGRGRSRALLAVAVAGFLVATVGFPQLVPPVPLRVQSATFSSGLDRERLLVADTLQDEAARAALPDGLYVMLQVFAPTLVPTDVQVVWKRDGRVLREGRKVSITAHELGFRVWDAWRPNGGFEPGRYEVVMRTRANRVFGSARFEVTP